MYNNYDEFITWINLFFQHGVSHQNKGHSKSTSPKNDELKGQ